MSACVLDFVILEYEIFRLFTEHSVLTDNRKRIVESNFQGQEELSLMAMWLTG